MISLSGHRAIAVTKAPADFKKPFMTDGPYRIEKTPKHLAVREAIANCLVNVDCFQRWSVVIERYPDRTVLSNPGTIIPGKKQMLRLSGSAVFVFEMARGERSVFDADASFCQIVGQ